MKAGRWDTGSSFPSNVLFYSSYLWLFFVLFFHYFLFVCFLAPGEGGLLSVVGRRGDVSAVARPVGVDVMPGV